MMEHWICSPSRGLPCNFNKRFVWLVLTKIPYDSIKWQEKEGFVYPEIKATEIRTRKEEEKKRILLMCFTLKIDS